MCLETAAHGGESLIVSAGAIYNRMIEIDCALGAALFKPIATDRRGEVPEGASPYFTIPVGMGRPHGHVSAPVHRVRAALDLFDSLANDPEFPLAMRLDTGDMQFVHNHSMLHDRLGFTDKADSPRHLLRLWISAPDDRSLPPVFAQRFGTTTIGARGGIDVTSS